MRSIKGIIIGFLLILLGFAVTSYSLIAGGVLAALVWKFLHSGKDEA